MIRRLIHLVQRLFAARDGVKQEPGIDELAIRAASQNETEGALESADAGEKQRAPLDSFNKAWREELYSLRKNCRCPMCEAARGANVKLCDGGTQDYEKH